MNYLKCDSRLLDYVKVSIESMTDHAEIKLNATPRARKTSGPSMTTERSGLEGHPVCHCENFVSRLVISQIFHD